MSRELARILSMFKVAWGKLGCGVRADDEVAASLREGKGEIVGLTPTESRDGLGLSSWAVLARVMRRSQAWLSSSISSAREELVCTAGVCGGGGGSKSCLTSEGGTGKGRTPKAWR